MVAVNLMETEAEVVLQQNAQHSAVWWISVGIVFLIFAFVAVLSRITWVRERVLTTNARKQALVAFLALVPAVLAAVMTQVPENSIPVWILALLAAMGIKGGTKALAQQAAERAAALQLDLELTQPSRDRDTTPPEAP